MKRIGSIICMLAAVPAYGTTSGLDAYFDGEAAKLTLSTRPEMLGIVDADRPQLMRKTNPTNLPSISWREARRICASNNTKVGGRYQYCWDEPDDGPDNPPPPPPRSPPPPLEDTARKQANYLNDLANALDRRGDKRGAIEKYNEALRWEPANKTILANLALTEAEVARNAGKLVDALRRGRDAVFLEDRQNARALLQSTLHKLEQRNADIMMTPLETNAWSRAFNGKPSLTVSRSEYDKRQAEARQMTAESLTKLAEKKVAGKAIDLIIKDLPYYEVTYTLKQSFDLVERYKKIAADRAIDTKDWFEVWSQLTDEAARCLANPLGNCEDLYVASERVTNLFAGQTVKWARRWTTESVGSRIWPLPPHTP